MYSRCLPEPKDSKDSQISKEKNKTKQSKQTKNYWTNKQKNSLSIVLGSHKALTLILSVTRLILSP